MSTVMTQQQREEFLASLHVGIISIAQDGMGPLAVPIWYAYEPGGEVWLVTAHDSRKGQLLEKAGRFSLCAQNEKPPYRYVSVEGPIVAIEPSEVDRDLRPLAHRYLGVEGGDLYIESTGGEATRASNVKVRMRPEHWLSADYSKIT